MVVEELPENIELVRESLTHHGNRSLRRNGLGLSRSSYHRIAKHDVRFHPYVMIMRQELKDGDPVQRISFCNQLVNTVEQKPQFLDQFIVSDEAVFSLNLEVNTKNVIGYSPHGDGHPAHHSVEFAQSADQVMVWVGLTQAGVVLGPHFAERNLDTREYLRIIRYHLIQRDFHMFNVNKIITWLQRDGQLLCIPVMQQCNTSADSFLFDR